MQKKVIVIIGTGGMGIAIARRIGTGRKLVLADYSEEKLVAVAQELRDAGYDVLTCGLDVVSKASVEKLAETASEFGELLAVINTAGVSSTINDSKRILEVNLLGNANVIEVFEKYVVQGTVGIIIASMAGYGITTDQVDLENKIKAADRVQLTDLITSMEDISTTQAYVISKRGNHLQVQAAALKWGKKGARILSISPGIIATPQSQKEMSVHASMRAMIENGPVGRLGTPEDIAGLVEFLHGHSASFMTGVDILIDGGQVAFMQGIGKITRNH